MPNLSHVNHFTVTAFTIKSQLNCFNKGKGEKIQFLSQPIAYCYFYVSSFRMHAVTTGAIKYNFKNESACLFPALIYLLTWKSTVLLVYKSICTFTRISTSLDPV